MCGWFELIRGALGGGYIGVAYSLEMSVRDSGECYEGRAVISGGGGICVGSRGVSERDC